MAAPHGSTKIKRSTAGVLDHRQADPALLATWARGHWNIEVLHWVRDVTFGEDHSQVRTDNGPTNLAALGTLAINALRLTGHANIAAGVREHARTPLLRWSPSGSHDDFAEPLGLMGVP